MTFQEKLIFFAGGPLVSILVILFALWWHYRPISLLGAVKEFCGDVKRAILTPLIFFFGYSCIVCGKGYLSAKKADACCRHKTVLYNAARQRQLAMVRRWQAEFGATPAEQRKKRHERFVGHFQPYGCQYCGKKHWTAEEAINCCKNKPTPPPINVDDWLVDCYWCGGSGFKFGVICDVCDGIGKLPRG